MSQNLTEASNRFVDLLDLQRPPLALLASETFLCQIGEANPWFEHNEPLQFSFAAIDATRPTTPEDMAQLYKTAHSLIGQAKAEAEAEGKTLRVAVGESHYNRNALACFYVTMSAALAHGITVFTDEKEAEHIPDEAAMIGNFYRERGEIPETFKPTGQPIQPTNNAFFWHQHPDFDRFDVKPVDTALAEAKAEAPLYSPEYQAIREAAMVQELTGMDENGFGGFGVNHLKAIVQGIEAHPGKVAVLALDVSHDIVIRNRAALTGPHLPEEARKIECQRFNLTSDKVTVLTVPGAGVKTAAEARDLAEAGIALAAPSKMHPGAFSEAIAQQAASHSRTL